MSVSLWCLFSNEIKDILHFKLTTEISRYFVFLPDSVIEATPALNS